MTAAHAFNGLFQMDNWSGVLTDIKSHVTNVDFQVSQEVAEVSGFGDAEKQYVSGQSDATTSVQGNWDDTNIPTVMFGAGVQPATRTFEYSPTPTSGHPKYTGEAVITTKTISSSKSDAVKFTMELQVTGAVTVGTNA